MDVITMLKSMTGYGRDVFQIGSTTVTVEIRTVNHRFLDFTAKIPRSFLFLEDKIKKVVQSFFQRGRIEVFIGIEGEGFVKKSLKVDWHLMDQYMEQINNAQKSYQLKGDIPASIVSSLPELIEIQEKEQQPDQLKDSILESVTCACEQVKTMQMQEGNYLDEDIKKRIENIKYLVASLKERRNIVIEEYRDRIQVRIEEQIEDTIQLDQTRMHQEIALLAEKGDITEEITRLLSHIDHFIETMDSKEPVGRKLDFILQEMHRETNTIGSKSTDPKISKWIILLKGDIEKIKEQVQNIE